MFKRFPNLYIKTTLLYRRIRGQIDKNHAPTKCLKCGCKSLVHIKEYYDEYSLCEYTLKCPKCDTDAGYWAYGYWDIFFYL